MYFFGALTTKTYSFKLRVWEIKELKSFNFLDTAYQKILVQYKNFQVSRILPEVVDQGFVMDWSWISDKTRFFFDSLNVKRTKKIVVAYKSKVFSISLKKFLNLSFCIYTKIKTLSYFRFLNYFFKKINIKKIRFVNLKVNLGFFQDLTGISSLKNFYRILAGYSFQIYKINNTNVFNLGNFNYFFNKQSFAFDKIKTLILFGLDLRFELPLCYLNFKKQIKFSKIQFYNFGAKLLGRINVLNLGLNAISFFEGRHWVNNQVVKHKNLLCLNAKYLTTNTKISFLFNKYLNLVERSMYSIFISDPTLLSTFEIGVFHSNDFFMQNKKSEKFSVNLLFNYAVFLRKKKTTYIFFETHMDKMHFHFFDIIFPIASFFEKSTIVVDLFGNIIKSSIVLSSDNKNSRTEKSLFNLSSLFFTKLNKNKLNFYSNINEIKFYNLKKNMLKLINDKRMNVLKTKMLFNYVKDFYLNDTVTRFSETLIYVKTSFLRLRNNY